MRRARGRRPTGTAEGSEAARWLEQARTRLAEAGETAARADLAARLAGEGIAGVEDRLARDPTDALAWARATAALLRGAPRAASRSGIGVRSRRVLAKALQAAGHSAEALAVLDRILRESSGDARSRADLEGVRCTLLARLGRMKEASAAANAARRTYVALGNRIAAALVDVNAANVLHRRDRHREALALYRRARRVLSRAGRSAELVPCELGIGNALTFLGRVEEARRAYAAAESGAAALGARHHALVAAYNRHYLDLLAGEPQAALDGLRSVRAGFVELGDERGVANCDLDMAEVFLHLRSWSEAESLARRALALTSRLGMPTEQARARLHLARALAGHRGPDAEVQELVESAGRTFRAEGNEVGEAGADLLSADLLVRTGRGSEAIAPARRAAAAFARHGVASRAAAALATEARALLLARSRDEAGRARVRALARRRLIRASRMARAGHWASVESRTQLARLDFEEGDVAAARRSSGLAVAAVLRLSGTIAADASHATFLGDLHEVFRDSVRYWLAGPRPVMSRAFLEAERSRCFALADGATATPTERRRALSAFAGSRAASAGSTRLRAGERGAPVDWRVPLADAAPEARGRARVECLDIEGVRRLLHPGEVVVEYVSGAGARGAWQPAAAFVISRDAARVVELPEADLVGAGGRLAAAADRAAMLRSLQPAAARQAEGALLAAAADLSSVLLEPLAEWTRDARRLVLVPHGCLLGIPFGVLPDPEAGRPMALVRDVVHAPAASWLARRPRRRPAVAPLLALGMSDRAAPSVEAEVRAVIAAAGGGTARTGARATRAALGEGLADARTLHLAGHGVFRWDNPGRSSLRLADGWTSLAELESLPFRTELTILSACQGGAVRAHGGGQFAGLTRALLRAGSRAVLASPWSVPDSLGLGLFTAFHGRIAAGLDAPRALREAQAEVAGSSDGIAALAFGIHGSPWCAR